MEKYKVFFISDTHFHHANILYFKPKRRELAGISLEELQKGNKEACMNQHDEWLINLWNNQVGKRDVVYILGDFCLGNKELTRKILSRLNGRKYLIEGNHDKSCKGNENYFEWIGQIKEAKFTHEMFPFIDEKETFCLEMCHFPMIAWNRRPHGTVHACGHVHGALDSYNEQSEELRVDVGLDASLANYQLIPLEKIYGYMKDKVKASGCETFQEYIDKLMEKQGYRI
jgi:calcineurin-like phosphoesterase family protein